MDAKKSIKTDPNKSKQSIDTPYTTPIANPDILISQITPLNTRSHVGNPTFIPTNFEFVNGVNFISSDFFSHCANSNDIINEINSKGGDVYKVIYPINGESVESDADNLFTRGQGIVLFSNNFFTYEGNLAFNPNQQYIFKSGQQTFSLTLPEGLEYTMEEFFSEVNINAKIIESVYEMNSSGWRVYLPGESSNAPLKNGVGYFVIGSEEIDAYTWTPNKLSNYIESSETPEPPIDEINPDPGEIEPDNTPNNTGIYINEGLPRVNRQEYQNYALIAFGLIQNDQSTIFSTQTQHLINELIPIETDQETILKYIPSGRMPQLNDIENYMSTHRIDAETAFLELYNQLNSTEYYDKESFKSACKAEFEQKLDLFGLKNSWQNSYQQVPSYILLTQKIMQVIEKKNIPFGNWGILANINSEFSSKLDTNIINMINKHFYFYFDPYGDKSKNVFSSKSVEDAIIRAVLDLENNKDGYLAYLASEQEIIENRERIFTTTNPSLFNIKLNDDCIVRFPKSKNITVYINSSAFLGFQTTDFFDINLENLLKNSVPELKLGFAPIAAKTTESTFTYEQIVRAVLLTSKIIDDNVTEKDLSSFNFEHNLIIGLVRNKNLFLAPLTKSLLGDLITAYQESTTANISDFLQIYFSPEPPVDSLTLLAEQVVDKFLVQFSGIDIDFLKGFPESYLEQILNDGLIFYPPMNKETFKKYYSMYKESKVKTLKDFNSVLRINKKVIDEIGTPSLSIPLQYTYTSQEKYVLQGLKNLNKNEIPSKTFDALVKLVDSAFIFSQFSFDQILKAAIFYNRSLEQYINTHDLFLEELLTLNKWLAKKNPKSIQVLIKEKYNKEEHELIKSLKELGKETVATIEAKFVELINFSELPDKQINLISKIASKNALIRELTEANFFVPLKINYSIKELLLIDSILKADTSALAALKISFDDIIALNINPYHIQFIFNKAIQTDPSLSVFKKIIEQIQSGNGSVISSTDDLEILIRSIKQYSKLSSEADPSMTALMQACLHGNIDNVQNLIDSGANLEDKDSMGKTALMYACIGENGKNVIQLLLDAGVNIEAKDNGNFTPLIWAAHHNNHEALQKLLDNHANIDAIDNSKMSALMHAASMNSKEAAEKLISAGANLEFKTDFIQLTALMWAAQQPDSYILDLLINANANVNVQDIDGNTALNSAAEGGRLHAVTSLITGNANVNLKNIGGATPLIKAAYYKFLDIVEALLAATALPDIQDMYGSTALIYAASDNSLDIAKKLLKADANPNIRNNRGQSAYSGAVITGNNDIRALLDTYNAEHNVMFINTYNTDGNQGEIQFHIDNIDTTSSYLNFYTGPDQSNYVSNLTIKVVDYDNNTNELVNYSPGPGWHTPFMDSTRIKKVIVNLKTFTGICPFILKIEDDPISGIPPLELNPKVPQASWETFLKQVSGKDDIVATIKSEAIKRYRMLRDLYKIRKTIDGLGDCFFITDPSNNSQIVSEGQAYWLLIAAHMPEINSTKASDYQTDFDKILGGTKHMINLAKNDGNSGFFSAWAAIEDTNKNIVLDKSKPGPANSAADADLDLIKSLIYAQDLVDKGVWTDNGYDDLLIGTDTQVGLIKAAMIKDYNGSTGIEGLFTIENGITVLRPSEDWNGYHRPDYLDPSTCQKIAQFAKRKSMSDTIVQFWRKATQDSYMLYKETLADTGEFPAKAEYTINDNGVNVSDLGTDQDYDGIRAPRRNAEYMLHFGQLGNSQEYAENIFTAGSEQKFQYTNNLLDQSMYLLPALLTGNQGIASIFLDNILNYEPGSNFDSNNDHYYRNTLALLSLAEIICPKDNRLKMTDIQIKPKNIDLNIINSNGEWGTTGGVLTASTANKIITINGSKPSNTELFKIDLTAPITAGKTFTLDIDTGSTTFSWGDKMFAPFINSFNEDADDTTLLIPNNPSKMPDGAISQRYIIGGDGPVQFTVPAGKQLNSLFIKTAGANFNNFKITLEVDEQTLFPEQYMTLQAGWNTLSTDLFPDCASITDVISKINNEGGNVTEAYYYDGSWTTYTAQVGSQDFDIVPSSTIMIYSSLQSSFKINTPSETLHDYTFSAGWHNFTMNNENYAAYTAQELIAEINSEGQTIVEEIRYYYDDAGEVRYLSSANSDFIIKKTKGYFINIASGVSNYNWTQSK